MIMACPGHAHFYTHFLRKRKFGNHSTSYQIPGGLFFGGEGGGGGLYNFMFNMIIPFSYQL